MSLYHHVHDKDDLLDEVVGGLLAPAWRPLVDESAWREWIRDVAERLRAFLVGEPAALHVYLRRPPTSPTALERMAAMLDVLYHAGFDEPGALQAYAALQTYTVGFAALEASRARWQLAHPTGDPLQERLAPFTSPQQFAAGLDYLLEGIGRRAVARAEDGAAQPDRETKEAIATRSE